MAIRYVYKKAKARYSYNTNTTIGELTPSSEYYEYSYSNVYIINSFTCYANSVINPRYDASHYLSKKGETFTFLLNSYTEDNGNQIEVGYDEETGETDYEWKHTIPAGSYFKIGEYFYDDTAYARYNPYQDDDSDAYNLINGLLYAATEVVFTSYDSYDDDGGSSGVFDLESGTVKLVIPDVSYSSSAYSYFSSDSDKYVNTFLYGRTYTSGNSSYINQPTLFDTWQFTSIDKNYAYCPVAWGSETDLSMDPSAVALSDANPTAGSKATAIVTPTSTTLDYGTLTYTYQYSTNNGSTWTAIGTTTSTSISFTIPGSASQIKVRVQASDGIGYTSSTYIESSNYTVNQYTSYAGVSGVVKGIKPVVCVSGAIKTSVTTKKGVSGVVK